MEDVISKNPNHFTPRKLFRRQKMNLETKQAKKYTNTEDRRQKTQKSKEDKRQKTEDSKLGQD